MRGLLRALVRGSEETIPVMYGITQEDGNQYWVDYTNPLHTALWNRTENIVPA